LDATPDINGVIKSQTIKLAEHVKNAYEICIGNFEGKRAHGIPWRGLGWKHMG